VQVNRTFVYVCPVDASAQERSWSPKQITAVAFLFEAAWHVVASKR